MGFCFSATQSLTDTPAIPLAVAKYWGTRVLTLVHEIAPLSCLVVVRHDEGATLSRNFGTTCTAGEERLPIRPALVTLPLSPPLILRVTAQEAGQAEVTQVSSLAGPHLGPINAHHEALAPLQ